MVELKIRLIFYFFIRATQEKAHIYKEELSAAKKQLDLYEKRMIKIEIENKVCCERESL